MELAPGRCRLAERAHDGRLAADILGWVGEHLVSMELDEFQEILQVRPEHD